MKLLNQLSKYRTIKRLTKASRPNYRIMCQRGSNGCELRGEVMTDREPGRVFLEMGWGTVFFQGQHIVACRTCIGNAKSENEAIPEKLPLAHLGQKRH